MDLSAWGIDEGYHDLIGAWRVPPRTTLETIARAMGAGDKGPSSPPVVVVRRGERLSVDSPARVYTEDGGEVEVGDELPPDMPCGYHRMVERSGRTTTLIIGPGRCHLPPNLRVWGWGAQLFATRSRRSWGIGDLRDLKQLASWAAHSGAGVILLTPLHSSDPTPAAPSPYFPSSRCWRNPLYLDVEAVPGAAERADELEALAAAGRALNEDRRIDRAAVARLKRSALELIWNPERSDPDFDAWRRLRGLPLAHYGVFMALSEIHGSRWKAWPEKYRHPESPAVAGAVAGPSERAIFNMWLQYLLELQLEDASTKLALIQDLAVGVDPDGFDAWMWQDVIPEGVGVGAPPDDFNDRGQGWGVAPFDPWRLRAASYEPFIQTVRAALRFGGGLRYDHVMGLFRLFWIPSEADPAEGTYVRYPASDLLEILALESQRWGAFVVGEDLGTVEEGVREQLAARNILSYRLPWFEPAPPAEYPELALAAVTNHDLPTIPGLWTGADLAQQVAAGIEPNRELAESMRARIAQMAGLPESAPADEAVEGAYRLLSAAPCAVVIATLEDALGVAERPNLPGTSGDVPNWTMALPIPTEEIFDHPGPRRIAAILAEGRERRPRPAPAGLD